MNAYTVRTLNASTIVAGDNDRRTFPQAELEELAASISADGLGQPPTVRPMGAGRYQLVCGERRTRAMRDVLGWSEIPCIVREMPDAEASALMLAENTARADLDPIDEAGAYAKRVAGGATVAEVARTAGRSEALVRARLRLLDLSEASQHLARTGGLPLGHAVMMAGLDSNRQLIACKAYDAQRLDAVGFGALCSRLLLEQGSETMFDPDSFMRAEEYAADAAAVSERTKDLPAELARLRARVRQLEAAAAGTDDLLGVQELANALGVQVRTVHMWQHRGRLPERDATVSGLPAWRRSTVARWAAETGRVMRSA